MRLSRSQLKRGDVLAIIAVLAFLGFLFLIALVSSLSQGGGQGFNFGFGADMDCQNVGYGEPVCTKKR